jgi:hypothetical protein
MLDFAMVLMFDFVRTRSASRAGSSGQLTEVVRDKEEATCGR